MSRWDAPPPTSLERPSTAPCTSPTMHHTHPRSCGPRHSSYAMHHYTLNMYMCSRHTHTQSPPTSPARVTMFPSPRHSVTSLQPPTAPRVTDGEVLNMYASPVDLLVCDVSLDSRETRAYTWSCVLPVNGPGTYRGVAVKYSYRVVITAQCLGQNTQSVTVPVKVFQFMCTFLYVTYR